MGVTIRDYYSAILGLTAGEGPFLTISLDLSYGPDGRPVAAVALHKALAAATAHAERPLQDLADLLGPVANQAVERATASGALGLFLVGSRAHVFELEAPLPLRNHVRLGALPWVFELEREFYFLERALVFADVSRTGVRMVRVAHGEASEVVDLDRDENLTKKTHGRTAVEGRSGAPGSPGGHSRNRVERMVEEKRAAAAREAVGELMTIWRPGDLLAVTGSPEPKAELLSLLPAEAATAVVTGPAQSLPADERSLLRLAAETAAHSQIEAGDALAAAILGGAEGERIARAREAVDVAFAAGRVADLVLHEDVVLHWGNAADARRHLPGWDDAPYERMVHQAHESSAKVWFSRLPQLLEQHEGVAARTRW